MHILKGLCSLIVLLLKLCYYFNPYLDGAEEVRVIDHNKLYDVRFYKIHKIFSTPRVRVRPILVCVLSRRYA